MSYPVYVKAAFKHTLVSLRLIVILYQFGDSTCRDLYLNCLWPGKRKKMCLAGACWLTGAYFALIDDEYTLVGYFRAKKGMLHI